MILYPHLQHCFWKE